MFNDEDEMRRWRAALAVLLMGLGLLQVAAWAISDMPRAARLVVLLSGMATAGGAAWQTYTRYRPRPWTVPRSARVAVAGWAVAVGALVVVAGLGTALAAGWLWLVAIGAFPWREVAR